MVIHLWVSKPKYYHTTTGVLENDDGFGLINSSVAVWCYVGPQNENVGTTGCLPLHTAYGSGTSPRIHYSEEEPTKKETKREAQINKLH